MRTRVKICGFTRVEDAVYAAKAGADAIGLVFYPPSPRHVSIKQASVIARAMPAFTTVVALFVDAEETTIQDVLANVMVDCLQFHGNEPATACRMYDKPYIKACAMREDTDINVLASEYHDAAGLLLDTYNPSAKGGTGQTFNWAWLPKNSPLPIILAGGLEPGNASLAIQTARPYALDVSSGVESGKGLKDATKISAFLKAVTEGDKIII
jgi:phosphoribosylanthranilate isomerase